MEHYKNLRSTLCGYLRKQFRSAAKDDNSDAVDDTFADLHQHPERLPANPRARFQYIKTVCFRTLLRILKYKERYRPLEMVIEFAEDDKFASIDMRIDIHKAFKTLTPKEREVIEMHCIEGYNYAEISELLSIKIDTIKDRLKRAKRKLRKFYPPPTIIVPKTAENRKYILKYFQRRPTHNHSLNTLYYITTNLITYADIHSTR